MKAGKESKTQILIQKLMRPVIRYSLRRSIKIQNLISALKDEYVNLAKEELAKSGQEVSISKISAVTGMQRKEISGRLSEGRGTKSKDTGNVITRVIGQWINDSRFSKKGKALPLDIEGLESRFAKLVRSVSSDLNHHTLVFELERIGLIKRKDKVVSLIVSAFNERENESWVFSKMSQDQDDLYRTVEANVSASEDSLNHHARTEFDNIPSSVVPKLRERIYQLGEDFHRKINSLLASYDRDIRKQTKDNGGRARIVFGSFSLAEELEVQSDKNKSKEKL